MWSQTISTVGGTNYTGANGVAGNSAVTFTVANANAGAITITDVQSFWTTGNTGAVPTLWASTTSLAGAPTIAGPVWTSVATGSALTIPSNGYYPTLSGLSYNIAPGATVRFALQSSNGIRYSGLAGPPSPNTFTVAGVTLTCGIAGVGYGGAFPSPLFNPRNFTGGITFAPSVPCAGTPNPGNVLSSASAACSGQNFTLSLQNTTSGTGVTYQWQSADDAAFTVNVANLGTASTQVTSQTAPKYYRATVDCPLGGGIPTSAVTSPPFLMPMSSAYPVDFTPIPFPPNCWVRTGTGAFATQLDRAAASAFGVGTGSSKWDFWNAPNAQVMTITSPAFPALPAGQQIRFDVAGVTYPAATDFINLEVSSTGPAGPWTLIDDLDNGPGGELVTTAPIGNFTPTAGQWATLTYPVPAGTNAVQFRGVSGFGNNAYVDNITFEPVPNCPVPASVTALGTSTTTANVAWTCAACTGDYIIEYGPAATFTIPGVGLASGPELTSTVVVGQPGLTYSIPGGLVHPTQYRVFVRQNCTNTANGFSTNSAGVVFYPAPPNDNCVNAPAPQNLAPGGSVVVSGNSFGATNDEGFGADVAWEAFTLTGCTDLITVDYCASTPNRTNAFVNLFTGCPHSAGFIPFTSAVIAGCGDAVITYANVPAGTYYIAIMDQPGAEGPYSITVSAGAACPPPPANDLCSNAVPISCGQTISGTTFDATTTGSPNTICNGFLNNTSGGVWYVATGLCGSVTATICASLPAWDSKIAVYSGSCGALVCVTTADDNCGALSAATWIASSTATYYIYVLGFGSANEGNFDLTLNCTNTPVVATGSIVDNCGSSFFDVFVNISDLGNGPNTINWTATPGGPGSMPGVLGANQIPVNFPAGTQVAVTVSNGGAGCTLDLGSFYSNCPVTLVCGNTLVVQHCYKNGDSRTFTYTAAPGQTATISFVSGTMDAGDVLATHDGTSTGDPGLPGLTGNFPNLAGASATSTGQNIYMEIVDDGNGGSCQDGDQSPWVFEVECTPPCTDPDAAVSDISTCGTYSFMVDVDILDFGTGLGAVPETQVSVRYTVNGLPLGGITVGPFNTTGSIVPQLGPFTIGQVVNVLLVHGSDPLCNRNMGNFDGDQLCPPPGYTCALPLQVNTYPYAHTNTTCGSGNDEFQQCAGIYGGGEDFIYQLNITTAGQYTISMQQTGGNSFGGWFLKSSANCANDAVCITNAVTGGVANGTASSIVTLAVGTYYLIIDTRPLPNCTPYILNIALYVPAPAEDCSSAVSVTCGSVTPGTTVGSNTANQPNACGSYNSTQTTGGKWYTYVGTGDQVTASLCTGTVFDTQIGVFTGGPCGPFTCVDGNDDSCGLQSSVTWNSVLSTVYTIYVTGFGAGTGAYNLTIACVPIPPAPANDLCAGAQPLTVGASGSCPGAAVPGTTAGSTGGEAPQPSCLIPGLVDVYYSFNSGANTIISFEVTLGTMGAIGIQVLDACGGNEVACIGDAPTGTFVVAANTNYIFRVLTLVNTTGTFTVCLSAPPPPPPNDNCVNAIAVGCNSATAGTTLSSNNVDNPGFCGADLSPAGGVWYTVTGWGGGMTATTCSANTNYDTKIGVFTGTCGAFTCVTGNDDDGVCTLGPGPAPTQWRSTASWVSTLGTTYYIYVTGFGPADLGNFELTVTCGDNTVACTSNGLTLDFDTDAFGTETSWEIIPIGLNTPACAGGGTYPSNAVGVLDYCCLPNGCYRLRVLDSFGDGMFDGVFTGGYILRTTGTNKRIIDNRRNFGDFNAGTTFQSAISGQQGFCLPIGTDALIYTSCDKLDWVTGQYIVASANPAVSAQFGVTNTTSGYEFWFFDPNGSYSFRRFRNHATSDGFAPNNANRACHAKINNWGIAQQIPANVLMNVRVRGRVANVNNEWGPACRFMIDPVRAACPLTKLMDIPGNQYLSCGSTRAFVSGQYVHARPVTGATQYQWRFRIDGEAFVTVRTTTTYFIQLNWVTLPLQDGKTYQVEVRVFKGGAWCVDVPSPLLGPPFTQWGDVCNLTIDNTPVNGGNENMVTQNGDLRMYPNPNRGDQLYLSLDAVDESVLTVSVDIFDLFGKRVSARTIPVQDGFVNTVLELNGDMANGMYMVNITAGEQRYTERLVIQK